MDYLSCTQINLYSQCPLKYKFQYIDKLAKPFRPSGLAFGGSLHAALCWLNKQRMNGSDASLDTVYKIFDADWYAQNIDSQVRFKNGESDTRLTIMAKEMLSLYFVRPHSKIRAAEQPFCVPFVNLVTGEKLPVNLEGVIDLIEEADSICEFKTSGQTMNQSDLDNHLQLTAYSYAYEILYRRPPRTLRLIDFVKTKRPKIIPMEVNRENLNYQRFFYLAKQILKGIRSGVFFPRDSWMCKDCEYGEPCDAWEGK